MPEYVATFFTHYDAICFQRALKALAVDCRLAPTPRALSSSCGTCARFNAPDMPGSLPTAECELLARAEANGTYALLLDQR